MVVAFPPRSADHQNRNILAAQSPSDHRHPRWTYNSHAAWRSDPGTSPEVLCLGVTILTPSVPTWCTQSMITKDHALLERVAKPPLHAFWPQSNDPTQISSSGPAPFSIPCAMQRVFTSSGSVHFAISSAFVTNCISSPASVCQLRWQ